LGCIDTIVEIGYLSKIDIVRNHIHCLNDVVMLKFIGLNILFFCIMASSHACFGQLFERTSDDFLPVYGSQIKWADLDNDDDLDIAYTGFAEGANSYYVNIYENTNGSFTLKNAALPDIRNGAFAFGDYDRDNDLDILLSGLSDAGNISALFENTGSLNFTLKYSFPGLINSHVSWFDIDNDEDLDFALTGVDDNSGGPDPFVEKIFVYENDGSAFVEIQTDLPPCAQCSMDWADGNGDGRIDVIITGFGGDDSGHTNLYLNEGDNTFQKDELSIFKDLYNGDVKWGDFDADGDMDLLASGAASDGLFFTSVYENVQGTFTAREDIALHPISDSWRNGTAWVDYDNDGLLDILVTGRGTSSLVLEYIFKRYKNQGLGTFKEVEELAFEGLSDSSVDFGDFDNDGDVDLCFAGMSSQGPSTGIFENKLMDELPVANTIPSAPAVTDLFEDFFRKEITLRCRAGSDGETPATALSYNFYLRNATSMLVMPTSDLTAGFLTTTNPPNAQAKLYKVNDMPEGQLFWAAQAIDGGKAGSPFSAENTFYQINGPEAIKAEIIDVENIRLSWKDNSSIETSYHVTRSTDPIAGFTPVASLPQNANSYVDNEDFLTNTFYYYRIYAANATKDSPYDSLRVVIPSAPFNLVAQPANASAINVIWEHESGYETGFVVERKLSSASTYEVIATLPGGTNLYADDGLDEGTIYDYRVRAINYFGSSAFSNTASAQTNFKPLGDDFEKEMLEDGTLLIDVQDFIDVFSDPDNSDQLIQIVIATLPQKGTLKLADNDVTEGQIILKTELAELKFIASENENGSATFDFYTHDGKDLSAVSYTVAINIIPVNDAPIISLIPDLEVEQHIEIAPIAVSIDDVDDPLTSITLSGVSDNQVLIMNANITFEGTTAARTVRLLPQPQASGEAIISITVSDGKESVSTQFKLTIHPVTGIHESYNGLNVYPNPFVSRLTVRMGQSLGSQYNVKLYDSKGRTVFCQLVNQSEYSFDVDGVGKGIYLLTVAEATGGVLFQSKVVKE
jgi:hypothetical protein